MGSLQDPCNSLRNNHERIVVREGCADCGRQMGLNGRSGLGPLREEFMPEHQFALVGRMDEHVNERIVRHGSVADRLGQGCKGVLGRAHEHESA